MDLTEAEDIKKWQEYTELYKKDLHDPDNHDGVITHLEPDILEKIPWRRERLPTPVFWPGELHGLYSPWGRKELDTTERLSLLEVGLIHFTCIS